MKNERRITMEVEMGVGMKMEIGTAEKREPITKRKPMVLGPQPKRNDVCRCGSGKKYKKCHLSSDEVAKDKQRAMYRASREEYIKMVSLASKAIAKKIDTPETRSVLQKLGISLTYLQSLQDLQDLRESDEADKADEADEAEANEANDNSIHSRSTT